MAQTLQNGRLQPTPRLFGDNRVYERWRWQIFAITWLAYFGFYLTRKSFSVAKIEIGEGTAIGLTQAQMAWIDGAFLTAYALGQFVWGVAGDKYGTRIVILGGMLCSVLTAVGMGVSSTALIFGLFFFLQGVSQSTGWAPLSKNIANFFSQRERGAVMGAWCTNYAVGGLVASIYAGYVGQRFGWRYAFILPAATLFVIWILFFLFQKNRPEDAGLPPIEQYHGEAPSVPGKPDALAGEADGSWQVILDVLKNPVVLLLAGVYFCLKPTRYAILFWGPKYISDKLGTGMAESGFLSALFELAGPIAILVGGVVSDRVFKARRMPVAIISLFALAVMIFFLDDLPATRFIFGATLFLIGLLTYAPDSLISGTAAIDFGTKKGASTASGLINGAGSIGAIVGGTIPGFFQKQWGWHGVFTFLAVAVLLAALLLLPKWNALPDSQRNGG
ncbi:MAG: MFS transporter [Chloroflexi bacterium]|nr:MFS transporter [Chloroflexota bacterium]